VRDPIVRTSTTHQAKFLGDGLGRHGLSRPRLIRGGDIRVAQMGGDCETLGRRMASAPQAWLAAAPGEAPAVDVRMRRAQAHGVYDEQLPLSFDQGLRDVYALDRHAGIVPNIAPVR
jgi:hypothetical protein